jgi:hypothetical protein
MAGRLYCRGILITSEEFGELEALQVIAGEYFRLQMGAANLNHNGSGVNSVSNDDLQRMDLFYGRAEMGDYAVLIGYGKKGSEKEGALGFRVEVTSATGEDAVKSILENVVTRLSSMVSDRSRIKNIPSSDCSAGYPF